jgi:large subunit ribosomal protein L18
MDKKQARLRRARKTRAKIAELKVVRLCVHRSNSHIYAQIIDGGGGQGAGRRLDHRGDVRKQAPNGGNVKAAALVGKLIAERAKAAGIERLHSIAPASCTTVASRPWPKPRVKADSSSKRG